MPDALPTAGYVEPGFSEFHRAQLRVVADGATGDTLPRATILAALRRAEARTGGITPQGCARLRIQAQSGRQSIFVWTDEAEALLAALPQPTPPRPAEPLAEGDPRRALIGLAHRAHEDARTLAGPDDRIRDAFHRLGEQALAIAALLPPAVPPEITARAGRLFGSAPA